MKNVVHQNSKTQLLIRERASTHGDFNEQSYLSQELKKLLVNGLNWPTLTCVQREALEMIMHKVSRILSGDADCRDHWVDCSGYAELVIERMREEP